MQEAEDLYRETEAKDTKKKRDEIPLQEVVDLFMQGENIADHLSRAMLEEIGNKVCEDFDVDKTSRSEWEESMDKAMELAMQVQEAKSFPYEGAANVKFPLLTVGCIQFASRAGPQIVRLPDPVRGVVNGEQTEGKKASAKRIGKHMSYQLRHQIDGWEDDMDTLLHTLPIMGSEFKKTYYDGEKVVSSRVTAKNLVFDYYAKDVETARRKTEILEMHRQEIMEKQRDGSYRKCELTDPDEPQDRETQDKIGGKEPPEQGADTPHTVLEQHRWWDIDGDGYEEPYVVTVDRGSKKVLRVAPRFEPQGVDLNGEEIVKITPVEYYTQYKFFPDPSGGSMGLGWGHLLFPINEVVNTTVNQLLDAGTWANTNAGLIAKDLAKNMPGGIFRFKPNTMLAVNAFIDDMKKGIFLLPKSPPSPVLFNLLGMMVEWGQRLTSVTDTMAGQNPPTNQPATTTLAMLEQGLQVFQGVHKRIFRALNRELRKIKALNKKHLADEEYFRILDVSPQELAETDAPAMQTPVGVIYGNDYRLDDTDVEPTADPTVQTEQQALARERAITEGAQNGMPFDPNWMAKRYLSAIGVPKQDQEGAIAQPQPPPPDPKLQIEQMRQQMEQAKLASDAQFQQLQEETKRQATMIKAHLESQKLEFERDKQEWEQAMDRRDDQTKRFIAQLQTETQKIVAAMGQRGND